MVTDVQATTDRVEIEALRASFTDAGMRNDFERFASLFTADAAWRVPAVNAAFTGREEILAGIRHLKENAWSYLLQAPLPGSVELDGDSATGRAYVVTFGQFQDGGSHLNFSVYYDRYERTPDGWKFKERVDEVLYLDTSPLAGGPPKH